MQREGCIYLLDREQSSDVASLINTNNLPGVDQSKTIASWVQLLLQLPQAMPHGIPAASVQPSIRGFFLVHAGQQEA